MFLRLWKRTSSRSTSPIFSLPSSNMEEKQQSSASKPRSLAEIDLPTGDGPKPHPTRFLDPREVEIHFAPLLKNLPTPAQRWARKSGALPFPGL